jgi:hypothetical protein
MRTHLLSLLLLLFVSPGIAAAQQTQQSDTARVRATIEALFAAAERGDLAALDTLYAGEDLTVIEGAGIDRTWAQ